SGSDGTLYGLFATTPAILAKIDKTTGTATTLQTLPTIDTANATDWTFSSLGGDFWIFAADTVANPNATTTVSHLQSSGGLSVAKANIGFLVDAQGAYTACP